MAVLSPLVPIVSVVALQVVGPIIAVTSVTAARAALSSPLHPVSPGSVIGSADRALLRTDVPFCALPPVAVGRTSATAWALQITGSACRPASQSASRPLETAWHGGRPAAIIVDMIERVRPDQVWWIDVLPSGLPILVLDLDADSLNQLPLPTRDQSAHDKELALAGWTLLPSPEE